MGNLLSLQEALAASARPPHPPGKAPRDGQDSSTRDIRWGGGTAPRFNRFPSPQRPEVRARPFKHGTFSFGTEAETRAALPERALASPLANPGYEHGAGFRNRRRSRLSRFTPSNELQSVILIRTAKHG